MPSFLRPLTQVLPATRSEPVPALLSIFSTIVPLGRRSRPRHLLGAPITTFSWSAQRALIYVGLHFAREELLHQTRLLASHLEPAARS